MDKTSNFDRAPLKDIRVRDNQIGLRTPQILISRENGEYMKGDILDANATMMAVKAACNCDFSNVATKDDLAKYLPLTGGKVGDSFINTGSIGVQNAGYTSVLHNGGLTLQSTVGAFQASPSSLSIYGKNGSGRYDISSTGISINNINGVNASYDFSCGTETSLDSQKSKVMYQRARGAIDGGMFYYYLSPIGVVIQMADYKKHNNRQTITGLDNIKIIKNDDCKLNVGKQQSNKNGIYIKSSHYLDDDNSYAGIYIDNDNITDEQKKRVGIYMSGTTDNDVVASKYGVKTIGKDFPSMEQFDFLKNDLLLDSITYGVQWEKNSEDPTCTRIGNIAMHQTLPIQSQYKGCVVKDGKLNYWLDPNDWSKKADGTPSVLDGTDGDVCVHTPKFYCKSGSDENTNWVRISQKKIDDTWAEIPELYIGAYHSTRNIAGEKISIVNTNTKYRGGNNYTSDQYDDFLETDKFRTYLGKPVCGHYRENLLVNNKCKEPICYEFYKWIFYWNCVIEYSTFDLFQPYNPELTKDGLHQGGIDQMGVFENWSSYNNRCQLPPCGFTNEIGNFSGIKSFDIPKFQAAGKTYDQVTGLHANRYRGFENPFPINGEIVFGIVSSYSDPGIKIYTTTDSHIIKDEYACTLTKDMNLIHKLENDYIGSPSDLELGESGEIMPNGTKGAAKARCLDFYISTKSYVIFLVFCFNQEKININCIGSSFCQSRFVIRVQ